MSSQVKSVMDYYNKGVKLEQDLYFSDVNVPTRVFTEGFATKNGEVLIDASGTKLIENFAIEYTSILKLSDQDREGHYEISLLSDDGARLFVKDGDAWSELVNNDKAGRSLHRILCAESRATISSITRTMGKNRRR